MTPTRVVRFGARDYDAETGRWMAKDREDSDGLTAMMAIDPSSKRITTYPDGTKTTLGDSVKDDVMCRAVRVPRSKRR